ncbi:adapter protein MecA 1/2 [Alteribacillus persepolensis]|uniref:Adapter protein MecA n=1 Tax=Alteribacillus persepolensis TaxID=568899 RepID=A0A1G8EPK2_9BACI|nr:adaptor protein MecA [Alteribacillus persepolensis]SDH71816.1 adapter protein MecA 1/2 [Alteribacillus persepolensis]
MEIERINESTVKFYITYKDIEDRGFDRDEIWYNRERGEELFFEMINEAHDRENFEIEGPLWIQVQAMDNGMEIVVTRGQISEGNVKLEIPVSQKGEDLPVDDNIVDMLDEQFRSSQKSRHNHGDTEELEIVISFSDLEDLLSLSQAFVVEQVKNEIYHFEGTYYLYLMFDDYYSEDEQDDMVSHVLEYGEESDMSIHRIREYGKTIAKTDGLQTLRKNFS